MRVIAAISQPYRVGHCQAYLLGLAPPTPPVILTSDPVAFAQLDLPSDTSVISVPPSPEMLPTARLVASRLARRFVNWARSGSSLGARVERLARSVLWRLRYLDRLAFLWRSVRRQPVGKEEITASPLLAALERLHAESPVGRVVVFDLFDLPASLRFADRHGAEVVVR